MAPSREEEEHFAKLEYEKRRALAEKARAQLAVEEREKLKQLHFMRCPKCGSELLTVALHAVQVDKCPNCSGLWLDAGEIDQIIARDGSGALQKVLAIFK